MAFELFSSFNRSLATKIAGWLSSVFQGVCVVLLAVIIVRLVWLLLAPGASVSTVTFSGLPPGPPRVALSADLSFLTRENAFGTDTLAGQELTQAPETKLNFRLVGLRSVAGDGQGSATIVTPDGLQKRFVVGGEVIPGVRVEEILADRVVLSHNGALESLTLGPGKDRYSVVGSDQDAVGPAASVPGPVVQDSTVRSTVSRQFLSQISLSTVGLETGESGYRMAPRGDERVLLDAGFANGDIIINVNGQEVDAINPEEVYNEFQESEQLSLKVRRGEETLNFELAIS